MAILTGISPVLFVADLERSVAWYTERLGFACEVYGEPPNFATAGRDSETILLALAPTGTKLVPHWQIVEKAGLGDMRTLSPNAGDKLRKSRSGAAASATSASRSSAAISGTR